MARHRSTPPRSVLDVGCGTGRLLEALAGTIPECWGVDYLASNVAHARARHPGLVIHQGDMRTVRLGRTFDLITSFGNVLAYALTDEDLRLTAATLAAHAAPGSLLLLDALNARAYLDGGAFRERIETEVDAPGFRARSVATHTLDRAARRLTRTRVWHIAGEPDVQDHAEYRLLDPEELTALLEGAGFRVAGLYDNRDLSPSALLGRAPAAPDPGGMGGRKLYAVALRP
jgi:SAM-dependent methyltransferase